ncbi:MAG: AAA family ATPase [Fuerstia sp.]|nr:AAA family ATPase [Fuerstiella sp.]
MYETHFGFHRQPFHSADACRAFFVSESIRTILPQLLHALRSDLGIAVLTGVPGSGRTSLLRHIQQQLSNEGRAIVCSGASLGTSVDLIAVLLQASRMKAGSECTTKSIAVDSMLSATRSSVMEHMKRTAELWGPILLLIDDAQLVPLSVLNELRACTEEEWNGRDLVRCLVSAPISFEEQLARSEYAEFSRRIRCHAFLQPFKSVESIRFLQEQIEFAGGRLSQVLTTPALELIATAAAGIPRCLSLLADETLVVAAECGEKTATEQSVRTALGHLQHLQYHWNASAHADIAESTLSEDEHTAEESIRQAASPSVAAITPMVVTVSRQTPARATLSPGVIEFGGPSAAAADVRPAMAVRAPSIEAVSIEAASIVASWSHKDEPTTEVADREEDLVAPPERQATRASAFEFGVPQSIDDVEKPERVTIRNDASATFEVGRRFFAESSEDSISIEDVDDSEIVSLLNQSSEFEHEPWGVVTFSHTTRPLVGINSPSDQVHSADREIIWIDGSPSETDSAEETIVADGDSADQASAPLPAELVAESARIEPEVPSRPADDWTAAAARRTTHYGFIDLGDSRMSNRTPVFDRYTWLALGREVPPGASSMVSLTKSKQLMLADYGTLATNQLATLSLQTASRPQTAAIDHIPVTHTTDSILTEEILNCSPHRAAGSFELFSNVLCAVHESPQQIPAHGDHQESPTRLDHPAASDERTSDFLHDDLPEVPTDVVIKAEAEVLIKDEALPAFSGLKIWHDGQLIFSQSDDSESPDASAENDPHSGATDDAVHATAPEPRESATKLGRGGFFTLPAPIEKVDWDLRSPGISDDHDVFPIVESITSLRSDVRQFQQTGKTPSDDAGGTDRGSSAEAEQTSDADSLISRAKRRLDDRTSLSDSTLVALQIAPEARAKRALAANADSEVIPVATSNSGSAPQFSRLFTRLWENRRRAAGQTETDR